MSILADSRAPDNARRFLRAANAVKTPVMTAFSRRRLFTLFSSLAAAGLFGCASAPVMMVTSRAAPVSTVSVAEAGQRINALRAERDLPPVRPHPALQRVAEEQAAIMARTTRIAHTSAPGEGFMLRLRRQDFLGGAGENLAGGPPDLPSVLAGWMASPAHHRVMVDPTYVQFGIAVARGAPGPANTHGTYWVLIMGVATPDMAAST